MRTNWVVAAADNGNLPLWRRDITVKQGATLRCHVIALGRTTSHIDEILSGSFNWGKKAISALALSPIPSIWFAWLRSFQYDFVECIHYAANPANVEPATHTHTQTHISTTSHTYEIRLRVHCQRVLDTSLLLWQLITMRLSSHCSSISSSGTGTH